jgi:putative ABC transport system permease protein
MGMAPITRLIRRVRYWLGARRHAADLAAELEDHRIRLQAAIEADGVPRPEAIARSRRAMGNLTLAREDARHVWIASAIERVWADMRYGIRALRREPSFTATALLTLTLGIFTTTTVFTVVDAEVWKPLPFRDPGQLVAVAAAKPGPSGASELVSIPDFVDWSAQSALTEYAAEAGFSRRVLRRGVAEYVHVKPVSTNFFVVLNHVPRLGRGFDVLADQHARVAILSDRGWKRLLNGDGNAVGRVLNVDGTEFVVIGVNAGLHFGLGDEPDMFIPLDAAAPAFGDRLSRTVNVIGRVRSGVAIPQAQAELQTIAARIAASYPDDHAGHRVELGDMRLAYVGFNWRPLFFFLAAATMVLMLACLNVAGLLLARALRRQREFAIRGALGGGRAALARQMIVEGALLAIPGAAAATVLAAWTVRIVGTQLPEEYFYRGAPLALDGRILLVVAGLTAITTILLSLAPMVFAQRLHLNVMLGQGARAGTTPGHVRARTALLVAQLTLTLVLVTAAGLFVQSFMRLLTVPLGFDPADRLSVRLTLTGARYAGDAPVRVFAQQLLERVRAIPGIDTVPIDTTSPLDSGPMVRLAAADQDRPTPGSEERAIIRSVSPAYFRTLGMRFTVGRAFSEADGAAAPRVAILNEVLASRLFPGENAVGRRVDLVPGARTPWTRRPGIVTIVGVVANIKDIGFNEAEFGNLYLPFEQAPAPGIEVLAKTSQPAGPIIDAIRRAVADLDPVLPLLRIQPLDARVDAALRGDRFNLILIATFAVLGIVLAAVGIYGAMACAVRERTREFGVRLALGQPPRAIVRATLWQSARLGVTGAVMGLVLVFVIARMLGDALYLVRGSHNGILYGVTTTDPLAVAVAAIALVVIATLAGIFPAREATRVDPLIALRQE